MPRTRLSLPVLSILVLALWPSGCEQTRREDSRRVVFQVQAGGEGAAIDTGYVTGPSYVMLSGPESFTGWQSDGAPDSAFSPLRLSIEISLLGELIPSLININGCRVHTSLQLEGGTIEIDHTNQVEPLATPAGDTLYAVRGEGIISSGTGPRFQNITGLFFEESTYRISTPTTGGARANVERINCRYELIVDF